MLSAKTLLPPERRRRYGQPHQKSVERQFDFAVSGARSAAQTHHIEKLRRCDTPYLDIEERPFLPVKTEQLAGIGNAEPPQILHSVLAAQVDDDAAQIEDYILDTLYRLHD